MNPENQQIPQPPVQPQPTPIAPQLSSQQPAAFSATPVGGMKPPTTANLEKQKKLALILGIASIVIFVGGLLLGYVFAAAAFLGAYALVIGIRTKAMPQIVIGAIGLLLNFGLYTLSIFIK